MKKLSDIIKPVISIVFGVLLFLVYMNWLQDGAAGGAIAIGVIALVLACFYVASGIIAVLLGEKMPAVLKKVFDIVAISAYAIFVFIYTIIVLTWTSDGMGPTAWFIAIFTLSASIAFAGLYIVAKCVNVKLLTRLALLLGAVFVLALLLDVLFGTDGSPTVLGNIVVITVLIYGLYAFMVFSALKPEKAE